ncbi:MFS general substrate transporter [Lophium mytilinum]|uniref:MFS general substrate transporter n=1 Tax=Lophium mytilinum TaxID=390894 RepID=A0A6A6Q9H3_9PEZI|nr:MFS general substrate transporter [Lophium mytilinum]
MSSASSGVLKDIAIERGSYIASSNSSTTEKRRSNGTKEAPPWKPNPHELAIMLSLALISLMVSLDATIVITSLSTIVRDLGASSTGGFWIGTSYLLTCAATMPFTTSLSSVFGRPPLLLFSLALFTTGTLLCAVSHSLALLLAGRCVQGIGGGGIISLSLVIFTDIVPLRFRSKYYGIIQGAWAFGTCIGPVIGGVFVEKASWRWVFYVMFPFCGIGLAAVGGLLTLKPKTESLGEKMAKVDWAGGVVFIASCTSFLVAVSWGGTQEPWESWRTIVPLVLGALGMLATGLWERYGAKQPFLPGSLFYCPSAFSAYFGATVQGFLLYGVLYYGPLYFLAVHLLSPISAGVSILPTTLALVPASVAVGAIVSRVGNFRWAVWSGWVFTTLAHGLMILWDVHTSTAVWVVIMIILGLGHGLVLNAQNFATQAIAKPKQEGEAASMYAFLRSLGMALGVGVGGSVFQNVMKVKLGHFHLPLEIASNAEAYIETVKRMPVDSVMRVQVLESYVYGLRGVFGLFCGMAGLAMVASAFVGRFKLDKELESEHKLAENRWSRGLNNMA